MSLIEFHNVAFSYGTEEGEEKVDVLEDLNLNIEKGSFVAVLGHNGSGKSTLAKLTNGILFPSTAKCLWTVWKQNLTTVFTIYAKKSVWFFRIPITR